MALRNDFHKNELIIMQAMKNMQAHSFLLNFKQNMDLGKIEHIFDL